MKLPGFTEDEKDLLRDAVNSDIFNVFMKLCAKYVDEIQKDVLTYSLTSLNEGALSELAYRKMRGQGAEKLFGLLKTFQQEAKKAANK